MPPAVAATLAAVATFASLVATTPPGQAAPKPEAAAIEAQRAPAPKPTITKQPVSTWAIVGRKARFAVKAKSASSYRWQHLVKDEWGSVSGATKASLTLKTSTSKAGQYRVRVSNSGGEVYSKPVKLTAYPLTIMVGHRGDMSSTRPEQTMPAFRAAREAGANDIEFDVRWTSDNRMILMHDDTLNRTTNCTGVVEKHTFAQIRACDAGSYRGKKYAGTQVPTFEEVLAYAHDHKLTVTAEVKTRTLTRAQARDYIAAIKAADMMGRATMLSYSADSLAALRSVDPDVEVPTCWFTFRKPTLKEITASGSTCYLSRLRDLTPARVAEMHEAGVHIMGGPAITYADYRKAEALHVDSVLVNSVYKYRHWLDTQD